MNSTMPLACNMNVFTPEQREAHIQTTVHLFEACQQIQEIENGYQFAFSNEAEFITQIAEFIANERLCCPFLNFNLNISSNEPLSLSLTGPEGTQEFLREEFSEAFI